MIHLNNKPILKAVLFFLMIGTVPFICFVSLMSFVYSGLMDMFHKEQMHFAQQETALHQKLRHDAHALVKQMHKESLSFDALNKDFDRTFKAVDQDYEGDMKAADAAFERGRAAMLAEMAETNYEMWHLRPFDHSPKQLKAEAAFRKRCEKRRRAIRKRFLAATGDMRRHVQMDPNKSKQLIQGVHTGQASVEKQIKKAHESIENDIEHFFDSDKASTSKQVH